MLTRAAKQRYDLWMQQTRAEVTNAVNRVIEGKEAPVKVSQNCCLKSCKLNQV